MSLQQPRIFSLFDVEINNDSMSEAVERVFQSSEVGRTQTVCFVNVNTLNLAVSNKALISAVNDADYVFADGAGVRIASKRQGVKLRDNVNGTDMLPLLCERAEQEAKSIFLLGAKPGVAEQASTNLTAQFPNLKVAGTHHGYFKESQSQELIEMINESGADLLLVALGSPIQEQWLRNHRSQLNVSCALAVGGLLDFFSGRIPRAPLWMRTLGVEWVWRLMQEPLKKFNRYVIGNPVFLLRCFSQLKRTY